MGLLLLLQLFLTELYYISVDIFSISYNSSVYRGLSLIFGICWIAIYIYDVMKKRAISKIEILMILCLALISCFSLVTLAKYNNSSAMAVTTLQTFLVRTIPSSLAGIYFAKNRKIKGIFKWMDLISIYLCIGIINTMMNNSISQIVGREISFGGVNYQEFSYLGVLEVGIVLISLYNKRYSFKILNSKLFNIIRYLMLVIGIIATIYGTGRGALITLIVIIVVSSKLNYKVKYNNKNVLKKIRNVGIFIIIFVVFVNVSRDIPQIKFGITKLSKIFSTNNGINWEETSGRLPIYIHSLKLFGESPLVGNGINSIFYISLTGAYSHNIYLDLLVEGGLVYLIVIMSIIIYSIYSMIKLTKINTVYLTLIIFFLYSFVMLQFSGSYLKESTLWFTVFFTMYSTKNKISKEKI